MMGLPLVAPLAWFPSAQAAQLFSVIYMAWVVAEAVNQFIGRRVGGLRQGKDRGSIWLIGAMIVVVVVLSYGIRALNLLVVRGTTQFVGMALMAVGIGFRQWAIAVLGRHFSVAVVTDTSQQLVTEGPYRMARHPSYTGGILTLAGLPLALGAPVGLIVALALALPTYVYRARVEERALAEHFGEAYATFARTRPRFFPGL